KVMLTAEVIRKLADLKFELFEDSESKLLLVVCDDETLNKELRNQLEKDLEEAGKIIGFISATKAAGRLLQSFYDLPRTGKYDALALVGLNRLSPNTANALLRELNFHRDALIALKLPLIIWMTNELLLKLPSLAPDFWSRRTGVYRFSHQASAELLSRLFSDNSEDVPSP